MVHEPVGKLPRLPSINERAFADHHGIMWLAYESTIAPPESPARPCLLFESLFAMRRVFTFPNDWRELESRALERLSWGR